ncbi:MAG: carbamoyl-phosphate synthase large subunit, partial [Actinomycetota bacterium]|nr:carbamoyl-phosphate synthase large subunit [Actinomycetota bacterium]
VDPADVIRRARRALAELDIEGPDSNADFLAALLARTELAAGDVTTRFVEQHAAELVSAAAELSATKAPHAGGPASSAHVGAQIDAADPLAVLDYGRAAGRAEGAPGAQRPTAVQAPSADAPEGPAGTTAERAPLQGTVLSFEVEPGDAVAAGTPLAILEAMKMEHVIAASAPGHVRGFGASVGDTVAEDHPLVFIEPGEVEADLASTSARIDPAHVREDLQAVLDRHAVGRDAGRADAVERRHGRGHRTARENVADLVDPDTFVEYGPLVVAAQRRRRSIEDLVANTPADGMIAGIGRVNGRLFEEHAAQVAVASYDYMVLAGTQGAQNHRKKDRLFELAQRQRLPLVLFAEGGGGRPGDTDGVGGSGLDCLAFALFAELSGWVPLVGIANGRCFAGNAALLGCCDVVIATEGSNIGMGGPAMVEGGGLGVFRPEEIGPMEVQVPNGVVDLAVADEAEAVAVARKYLSYFQGRIADFSYTDQRQLRHVIPENRLRIYDVRAVIDGLFDTDTVLELRRGFGHGMVTALARIEGRPIGVVANDPTHLGGAIDAAAADKAARFMQLCDAHDLPIVFLCDTPGIMVGPEAEREGTVRHASRMFVTAASLDVPFMTIVLRKGYGLGAQAMAGGSFKATLFTVAWPTGEFGGMGLEGAVKLGMRKELEAETDPEARRDLYERLVARMYENGKAISTSTFFEIDDV